MGKVVGVARGQVGALEAGDVFTGENNPRELSLATGAGGLDGGEVGPRGGNELLGQSAGMLVAGGDVGGGGPRRAEKAPEATEPAAAAPAAAP